jgi:hypothetical protein
MIRQDMAGFGSKNTRGFTCNGKPEDRTTTERALPAALRRHDGFGVSAAC